MILIKSLQIFTIQKISKKISNFAAVLGLNSCGYVSERISMKIEQMEKISAEETQKSCEKSVEENKKEDNNN